MDNFKNIIEFQQYFHSEEVCREYLERKRWNGISTCPFCGSHPVYRFADGKRFKCAQKDCNKKFTVTVGTIYENSKVPLQKWFLAMFLISNHKKGISSCQLARNLGVTQKSAWFILHRIRDMHREKTAAKFDNVVQVDETYVGGKSKNRHADKKIPNSQGRSTKDKTPVLGAVDLNTQVAIQVVPDTKAAIIRPIIEKWVREGAIMVTDEWHSYNVLSEKFFHVVVKHIEGEYVRGAFTTNNIENYWSQLKRGIYGIYHHVSAKHLQRYCEEFAYKYNTRKIKDVERFEVTVRRCGGRLKYKRLIGKDVNKI